MLLMTFKRIKMFVVPPVPYICLHNHTIFVIEMVFLQILLTKIELKYH